jgi:hypothetical protein
MSSAPGRLKEKICAASADASVRSIIGQTPAPVSGNRTRIAFALRSFARRGHLSFGRSFGLHGGPPDEYDASTLTSLTLSAGAHMLGKILSVGVFGIDGYLVEAEFNVCGG